MEEMKPRSQQGVPKKPKEPSLWERFTEGVGSVIEDWERGAESAGGFLVDTYQGTKEIVKETKELLQEGAQKVEDILHANSSSSDRPEVREWVGENGLIQEETILEDPELKEQENIKEEESDRLDEWVEL